MGSCRGLLDLTFRVKIFDREVVWFFSYGWNNEPSKHEATTKLIKQKQAESNQNARVDPNNERKMIKHSASNAILILN